jgi:hypothetical protein
LKRPLLLLLLSTSLFLAGPGRRTGPAEVMEGGSSKKRRKGCKREENVGEMWRKSWKSWMTRTFHLETSLANLKRKRLNWSSSFRRNSASWQKFWGNHL